MIFKPHDYQQRAIEFIIGHPRCALFLDMGLGKTVSTLTALSRLRDWGEVSSVLVIAPKKVAEGTWSDEAAKWDHLSHLKVVYIGGTSKQKERALRQKADIYVLGRDNTIWFQEQKERPQPDVLVLDELTSFKNGRSLRFKALRRLLPSFGRVIGLTGTPAPNGMLDLWGQMYCIDGGARLGRFITHYREEYFNPMMHNHIVIKCPEKPGAREAILDRISDITLSMQAEDYLKLPDMIEETVPVVLPDARLRAYREFERERVLELNSEGPVTADSAGALVNKLMQFANGAIYDEDHNVREIHREKITALMEILESEQTPLLCFFQFRHDADRIMKGAPKEAKVRIYTGPDDLRDWNARKIDLLLCHPASTAFGLNMQQGGDRIVWYSTGWNLEHYQQANARLHRQGQQRPVRVFRLVAKGTVDERMLAAIERKGDDQRNVLQNLAGSLIRTYV